MKIFHKSISGYILCAIAGIVCFAALFTLINITSIDKELKGDIAKLELYSKGLSRPKGMVLNKDGRLFVQSALDGKISIVGKDGSDLDYTYVKGFYCYGIDMNLSGDFIIASVDRVANVDGNGKVGRVISGFQHIYDIKKGPGNSIFLSDSQSNSIYKITSRNEIIEFVKLDGTKSNAIANAAGICFDKEYNNLYVVNMYRGELYRIRLNRDYSPASIETIAANLKRPNFVAVDDDDNVYVTCIEDNTVVRVDINGIVETLETKGKLSNPSGIVFSNEGERALYVASTDSNSIYKLNLSNNQNKK